MARILAADDDPAILFFVKEMLEAMGHQVDIAHDGAEALELLKASRHDLLIIDRSMPRLDGIQALQLIRASPELKSLPVLMLTSASVVKQVDEAYAAGANGYLLKPINIDALMTQVKKALDVQKRP